ncbi:uncharacterized protein Z518_02485 [Rhinocladiella mackenziei CBS 650.93]|uniref:D-xylose reductase [NAD(P)H] n=1 Tax=Rhinocladiella mackenziei CBS 650.93 TaxID=1442369 RepID=A0A0D2IWR8_9EURO|nr:uncharacterized protein Z518_02485 [Rhinocladiella mackenziei CBS 650.93]KIX07831.1 hypothetical protein Z518_02485 [Rhinocladiella mackenziei CBS 650.93]
MGPSQYRILTTLTLLTNILRGILADQVPIQEPSKEALDIPPIGLGLWNSKGENVSQFEESQLSRRTTKAKDHGLYQATDAVKYAFDAGYRHLDSAAAYGNEEFVGDTLASSNVPPRHKYWVTSKLWNDMHQPKLVGKALNKTLSDLAIPYLDLYLMHWPVAFLPNTAPGRTIIDQDTSIMDTWRAMEDLVRANLTRYIGVSNFSPRQLDEVLKDCEICPFAHEFETHPYLQQQQFVDWHAEQGIKVIAYSPLANMNPTYKNRYPKLDPILQDPFWTDMAGKKNATPAQAILAWAMQRGTVVIPKSIHEKRIVENWGSLKICFSEDEMLNITEQDKRSRFNDPSKSWGVELFEGLDDGSNRFLWG